MKAMVGSSILENAYDAGVETAKLSLKGLKTPAVGLLFCSEKYKHEELLKGIKSVAPNLKVIGCTSSGAVMTPDGIISGANGYAAMMVLDDNELCVGVASAPRGNDPRVTGRKVAKAALDNSGKKYAPYAFMMFATPGEEEEYLKGIQDVVGEIPMFGGSACDNNLTGNWKVYTEENVVADGCAVAFLYTTKDIKNVLTGTYAEAENVGVITKMDTKRRILEIDNEPALDKYSEWVGIPREELIGTQLLLKSVEHPFGVKSLDTDLTLIRHPLVSTDEGSINVGANLNEKLAIVELTNDVDGLIGGAVRVIKEVNTDFKTAALLLVHSSERKNFIGERIDEDFVAIKNAAGDLPFIVPFTLAEYGQKDHTGAKVTNLSLSFTGFSE